MYIGNWNQLVLCYDSKEDSFFISLPHSEFPCITNILSLKQLECQIPNNSFSICCNFPSLCWFQLLIEMPYFLCHFHILIAIHHLCITFSILSPQREESATPTIEKKLLNVSLNDSIGGYLGDKEDEGEAVHTDECCQYLHFIYTVQTCFIYLVDNEWFLCNCTYSSYNCCNYVASSYT